MKPTKFIAHNVRLVEHQEIDFPNSGLVIIKAKNEKGKTTLINSFADLVKVNNTSELVGGQQSFTQCEFVTPDGEVLLLKQDLSANVKGSRFVLVDANGIVKKGIREIEELFKFNKYTIEEFIEWGKTKDGMRKQRAEFLKILPESTRNEFLRLESEEKMLYDKRTNKGNEEVTLRNVVEKAKPKEDEFFLAQQLDKLIEEVSEAEKAHLGAYNSLKQAEVVQSTYESKKAIVDDINEQIKAKINQYNTTEKSYNDRITELENTLDKLKINKAQDLSILKEEGVVLREKLDVAKEELQKVQGIDLTHLIKDEKACQENLTTIRKKYDVAKANKIHVDNYNNQVKVHKEVLKEWEQLDKDIKEKRKLKDEVVLNSECPIKNIRITDEGLEIFNNNMWLPYDEQHVATSVLIPRTAELIMYINKDLPVVLVSRGESILKERLQGLLEIAGKYDGIFLIERAEEGYDEIVCEIIEAE